MQPLVSSLAHRPGRRRNRRNRGDGLDLDQETVVELFCRHDGPRRPMLAEAAGVDRVDAAPQADVGDVHRGLEDVRQVAAGGLQDRGDVAQRLLGLLLDGADDLGR